MFIQKIIDWVKDYIKNNKFLHYFIASAAITIISIIVAYILIVFFNVREFWASAVVDFIGGTIQFVVLRNYIFKSRTNKRKTALQYTAYCINWVFNIFAVAALFVWILSLVDLIVPWKIITIPFSKGVAMLIFFVWNYFFHKHVTYKIK